MIANLYGDQHTSMRPAACGLRHGACGMRHAACGMGHAACGMRHAATDAVDPEELGN